MFWIYVGAGVILVLLSIYLLIRFSGKEVVGSERHFHDNMQFPTAEEEQERSDDYQNRIRMNGGMRDCSDIPLE